MTFIDTGWDFTRNDPQPIRHALRRLRTVHPDQYVAECSEDDFITEPGSLARVGRDLYEHLDEMNELR